MDRPSVYFILAVIFYLIFLKNVLFWVALWQIKEYRLDRFLDYLSTPLGRHSFFSKIYLIELSFFAAVAGLALLDYRTPFLVLAELLFIELLIVARSLKSKSLILPQATNKALLISFLTLAIAILAGWGSYFNKGIWSLLDYFSLLVLAPLLVPGAIVLVYPFSWLFKNRLIIKAKQRLAQADNLRVVGIAGSYGKTSVKEFASVLLAERFKVLKTEKNNNTEMGLAQTINRSPLATYQVLVAEMGAYKVKEIARLCQIAPPDVGVLTGIDEQHSALFGGQEKISQAKAEIITNTKQGGAIVLNYDNEQVRGLAIPGGKYVLTYALDYSGSDLKAVVLNNQSGWQEFIVRYRQEEQIFKTQLLGRHNVLNLLGALGVSLSLGLTLKQLVAAVAALKPPAETLAAVELNSLLLLNDSYNANPTGVKAALTTLADFSKKQKVVILDDILELGSKAKIIHQAIAEQLKQMDFAKLILVGKNYAGLIKDRLIKEGIGPEKILQESLEQRRIMDYLKSIKTESAVVLLEGRRSKKYFDFLTGQIK